MGGRVRNGEGAGGGCRGRVWGGEVAGMRVRETAGREITPIQSAHGPWRVQPGFYTLAAAGPPPGLWGTESAGLLGHTALLRVLHAVPLSANPSPTPAHRDGSWPRTPRNNMTQILATT